MSDKGMKMYDAVTEIRDDIVEQAADYRFKKSPARLIKPIGITAGVCVAVGAAVFAAVTIPGITVSPATGQNGEVTTAGAAGTYAPDGYPSAGDVPAYGGGGDAVTVVPGGTVAGGENWFWIERYKPPVMPLAAAEECDGLTAERELTFELKNENFPANLADADDKRQFIGVFTAVDGYTLTNTTGADRTVKLMYPFRCALNDLEGKQTEVVWGENYPTITVNGSEIKAEFVAGGYSGAFASAAYPALSDRSNLYDFRISDEYIGLLGDGTYLRNALSAAPTFDEPVIVYRVHDYGDSVGTTGAAAIAVSYKPGNNSRITTFGFNGYNENSVSRTDSFFLREGQLYTGSRFIIVRGDDISCVTLNGYPNGACEPGTEVPYIYGEVERLEMTYGELLPKIILASVEKDWNCSGAYESCKSGLLSESALCNAVIKYLSAYGAYSDRPIERYMGLGDLQFQIEDAVRCERIMYSAFEVTIPAGGSVTVTAKLTREAYMDVDRSTGDIIYSLEMFPALGSTPDFLAQTFTVTGMPDADITESNVGTQVTDGVLRTEISGSERVYSLRFAPKYR
ncbi:MAG: hypothetical protein IK093_09765 [Ruminiclostridium sp.]|nr:hypothetical protein [Ruminiclostridium sp.]